MAPLMPALSPVINAITGPRLTLKWIFSLSSLAQVYQGAGLPESTDKRPL